MCGTNKLYLLLYGSLVNSLLNFYDVIMTASHNSEGPNYWRYISAEIKFGGENIRRFSWKSGYFTYSDKSRRLFSAEIIFGTIWQKVPKFRHLSPQKYISSKVTNVVGTECLNWFHTWNCYFEPLPSNINTPPILIRAETPIFDQAHFFGFTHLVKI